MHTLTLVDYYCLPQNVLQIVDLCHIMAKAVAITIAITMADYDYLRYSVMGKKTVIAK